MSDKRDSDLNEEEDIIMEEIREEHLRDVGEDDNDKSKICALEWDVYTREKEGFIKKEFLVSVPHPTGGGIVWTCVKDNIIQEKDQYKAIGIRGFVYKLCKEEEGGRIREGLYSYSYLKYLIQL